MQRVFAILSRLSPSLAAHVALDRFLKPTQRALEPADLQTLARARQQALEGWNVTLQVYEWGEATAPTLLLMHGWASHAPRYSAVVEAALVRGWRVLAFDAPGHGRSSGRRSSLTEFRMALDAVIASHGPVRAVIAHSLGALAVASRLADPAVPMKAHAAVLVSLPRDVDYLLESYLQLLAATPALRERVHALFRQRFGSTAAALTAVEIAPRIECPVLLVHDRDDDVIPLEQAEELARLIPHATLLSTQGLGHSGPLRDGATIAAVLDFVSFAQHD